MTTQLGATDVCARMEQASTLDEMLTLFGDAAARLGAPSFRMAKYVKDAQPCFHPIAERVPEALALTSIPQDPPAFFATLKELLKLNVAFASQRMPVYGLNEEGREFCERMKGWVKSVGFDDYFIVPRFGFSGLMGYAIYFLKGQVGPMELGGLFVLASCGVKRAIELESADQTPTTLTARQREVLRFCAQGKSDWEIAQLMGLSPATVHDHIEAAKRRFGVRTRVQAVLRSVELGLL